MEYFIDFVLVGLPGSGKSYFANILNQDYHYNVFEIGDYVRKECTRLNISTYDCVNYYFANNDYLHFVSMVINEKRMSCICQPKIRTEDDLILGHFFVNKCASENCTKAQ